MKLIVCGETYSSNLGDPIIAASLAEVIRRADPGCEVEFLDMSGRTSLATNRPSSSAEANLLRRGNRALRRRSPGWRRLTNAAHWRLRGRMPLERTCADRFVSATAVVIGGGQLLMDNDLDFPLKIQALVAAAERADLPVALHACGVGTRWSGYGRRLVAGALARPGLVSLTVRDAESRATLLECFPHRAVEPDLCLDPALWASEAYGMARDRTAGSVGLAIMDPQFMRPHLAGAGRAGDEAWIGFWREVVSGLLEGGWRVELFTNGAPEDEAFADRVAAGPVGKKVTRIPRPVRPEDLVAAISRQSALVCARLHAGIIAYSLEVPTAAVLWDAKVRSFARETGREAFCFDPDGGLDAAALVRMLERAADEGIDPGKRAAVRQSCLDATRLMLERIRAAAAEGGGDR